MKKRKRDSRKRARDAQAGPRARSAGTRPASACFSMGAGASQRTLLSHLRKLHGLGPLRRSSASVTYHDTFDWRVHRRDRRVSVYEHDAQKLLSLERVGGDDALTLAVEKAPSFATDLAPGPLRTKLERLIKVRRLLPVAEVEVRSDHYAVLDDEQKTVVRIVFERAQVSDPGQVGYVELPPVLRVSRMRGYRRAHTALLAWLEQRRGLTPISEDLEDRALACLGREPRSAGSILDVRLDGDAPAGAAFVTLHRSLHEAMQINEPGVRADLDMEHLHEFRVAARRARVLERVFRDLIRGTEFEDLVPRIKWLRSVTGPTRDLDVQLLELSEERKELGEKLDALIPLEGMLREHRHAAWRELVDVLDSPEYAELVALASALLELPASAAARQLSEQGPALGPWASQRIARAARKLSKHGRRIDEEAPDQQLHRLRIEGKRLRYLLEFFRSLYPGKKLDALVRELRKLQDNLGAFNDACVRIDLLRELASELGTRGPASGEALIAVGRLIERASLRKASARAEFGRRFERFDAPKNQDRLRGLFGSGKGRSVALKVDVRVEEADAGAPREGDEE